MSRPHYYLRELGAELRKVSSSSKCLGRILIVDEEGSEYCEQLAAALPECIFAVESCPEEAKRLFLAASTDIVILAHSPRRSCLELLAAFKAQLPSVSIIVTTAHGSEDLAVQAFRLGAIDYFKKPLVIEELELSIRAILEIRKRFGELDRQLPVNGLQRALHFIETNFHAPIRLKAVAREAGMSVSCFERYIKVETGKTFITYLNHLRVIKASDLLQRTSTPILQIALNCGFDNQSNFNRVFRKIAGVSPGEYRKNRI